MKPYRIRTVTCFIDSSRISDLDTFIDATSRFEENDISIRTKRVAFENRIWDKEYTIEMAENLEKSDVWGFSTTFKSPLNEQQLTSAMTIIENTENGFVNFQMAGPDSSIDTNEISPLIDFISKVGHLNEGIDNFRVGISFGMNSATPFFPYSANNGFEGFSVGLEYIDLLMKIIEENKRSSLNVIRSQIIKSLIEVCNEISEISNEVSELSGMDFLGIDLSLAPYPYPLEEQSVIDVLEELGNIARSRGDPEYKFGMSGSIFLHTFITSIIKELEKNSDISLTGFNGVMYSVLEDTRLSQRFSSGQVSISDLLLTSTTCGCGIDMLPVTYLNLEKVVSGMIFDMYALSCALNKPLGLRVLPVPGARIGDFTSFKHLFFTNMELKRHGSGISIHMLPEQISDSKFNF